MSAKQSSRSNSAARARLRTASATTPSNFKFANENFLPTKFSEIVNLPKVNLHLPKPKPNYDVNKNAIFFSVKYVNKSFFFSV